MAVFGGANLDAVFIAAARLRGLWRAMIILCYTVGLQYLCAYPLEEHRYDKLAGILAMFQRTFFLPVHFLHGRCGVAFEEKPPNRRLRREKTIAHTRSARAEIHYCDNRNGNFPFFFVAGVLQVARVKI